jgi:hypothetical protein
LSFSSSSSSSSSSITTPTAETTTTTKLEKIEVNHPPPKKKHSQYNSSSKYYKFLHYCNREILCSYQCANLKQQIETTTKPNPIVCLPSITNEEIN